MVNQDVKFIQSTCNSHFMQDLTRAQLQSIQVGGQAGVYVPTLAQWLRYALSARPGVAQLICDSS